MELSKIPTMDLLREIARRCGEGDPGLVPDWARQCIGAVAAAMEISVAELMTVRGRSKYAAKSRQLAMALLREKHPNRSLSEIAGLWGQHHALVSLAAEAVARRVKQEPEFGRQFKKAVSLLAGMGAACRREASLAGDPGDSAASTHPEGHPPLENDFKP